jgi:hypothetical protein
MATKLAGLTHKIAIQLHLVVESCTICSSHSRRPVRELFEHTLVYKGTARNEGIAPRIIRPRY